MALINAKQFDKAERRWIIGSIVAVAIAAILKLMGVV